MAGLTRWPVLPRRRGFCARCHQIHEIESARDVNERRLMRPRRRRTNSGALRFADIRAVFIMSYGGDSETDKLRPDFERSLKRSLKTLVERRDVLIVHGKGGQKEPFTYTTVEALTDETDTDEAKRVFEELAAASAAYLSGRRP